MTDEEEIKKKVIGSLEKRELPMEAVEEVFVDDADKRIDGFVDSFFNPSHERKKRVQERKKRRQERRKRRRTRCGTQ